MVPCISSSLCHACVRMSCVAACRVLLAFVASLISSKVRALETACVATKLTEHSAEEDTT